MFRHSWKIYKKPWEGWEITQLYVTYNFFCWIGDSNAWFGENPMCFQWEEVTCSLGSLMCFVFPSKNVAYWRLESCLYTHNIVCTQNLESCNVTLNRLHYQTNIKCEMIWKFLLNVLLYTYDQTPSKEGWAMVSLEDHQMHLYFNWDAKFTLASVIRPAVISLCLTSYLIWSHHVFDDGCDYPDAREWYH